MATSTTTSSTPPENSATPTVTSAPSGNPFAGYQLYVNPYYSSEVYHSAIPSMSGSLVAKASKVVEVPSFVWLYAPFPWPLPLEGSSRFNRDTTGKVPSMDTYLADIKKQNAAGANPPLAGIFVVYDLPDRDCAALASNGEFTIANGGVDKYKAYIDSIREIVVKYSDVRIILVIGKSSTSRYNDNSVFG